MEFKTSIPRSLPFHTLNWESCVDLLGKAHATLARFDEIFHTLKNPKTVLDALTEEEALNSLRLPCTMRRNQQVIDYQKGIQESFKKIRSHSFSFQLMNQIHYSLMKNTKKLPKDIGQFRNRQNWIGLEGCKIEEAYFYPPDVRILSHCLKNWKKYFHYKEKDPLVQLAIFFAQLLVIHPYMDGNGRVARTLIPLFLYQKKLTRSPIFYLSGYFRKHRLKYFEKLYAIREKNEWEEWIRFFLKGVIEEGENHINTIVLTRSAGARFF